MSETQHIGRKIRNRRDELGWTLEYLAEKSELSSRALRITAQPSQTSACAIP